MGMHVDVHEYLSGWDRVKMKARGIAQAGSPRKCATMIL
jgi:hypothetical protein